MRRVWWRSIMLSEDSPAHDDWLHLVHEAKHAPDHVKLSNAIINLANYAMQQPVDHPIHQHFQDVMQHHAKHNREMLHDALENIAASEHSLSHRNAGLMAALEYTPTPHAMRMIARFMRYGHHNAEYAALGWLSRHPHLHEHYGTHILPILEEKINSRYDYGTKPFYRFMRDEYYRIRKKYGARQK